VVLMIRQQAYMGWGRYADAVLEGIDVDWWVRLLGNNGSMPYSSELMIAHSLSDSSCDHMHYR
jgi:hypothetical protein